MDFLQKAKIRIEHWIEHSKQHEQEYEEFADQLEKSGQKEAAYHIRELKQLEQKSIQALQGAFSALEKEKS